jgi:uncharacterized protein (TIGR04255 family)
MSGVTNMEKGSKDLPDYERPPVIEVVCGILFKSIDTMLAPHFGLLWEKYKPEYPICREVPPLTPVIERFGEQPQIDLQLANVPPLPRTWFVHKNDNGIIQVQRDRFLHNWKKVRPEDEYPRYPQVIKLFKDRLAQFESFLIENDLGVIAPKQYEMTYVNHIPQGDAWTTLNEIRNVFPDFSLRAIHRFLPEPEGINWRTSYVLPDGEGRLHVTIRHAKLRDSGLPMLLLDLTVRGIGRDTSPQGMVGWFDLAREWIVRGFADLTGDEVQTNIWRRKK